MFRFSDIIEIQAKNKNVTEKIISGRKEVGEKGNDTETEHASVEDSLNMYKTASNETTLVSEIPSIIDEENVVIAPGQEEKIVPILSDEFCEEQSFQGEFSYKSPRDSPICHVQYFKQRLLKFNQYFVSYADYIFFARHLRSSISFAKHKSKPKTNHSKKIRNNSKGTFERFDASDNGFSFMSWVKVTPVYWEQFLYDILAMLK